MSLNPANAVHTWRTPYTPVYVRGRANTASWPVYLDGALVAPSVGTYTLYNPAGESVVTDAVSVVSSVATFSLTSTHLPSTATVSSLYQEVWTLTLSGVVHTRDRIVAVAVRDWSPVVADRDLTDTLRGLAVNLPAGLTTFQPWLDEAWAQILGDLESAGIFPQQMMSPQRMRKWHRHLALALFFESCAMGQSARANWAELARDHHELARQAQAAASTRMDRDEDGKPDDAGELASLRQPVVHINAAPSGAYRRSVDVRWR